MANIVGRNYLTRYYEATVAGDEDAQVILLERLDYCLTKKYISTLEYDRAIAGLPPEGYIPQPTTMSAQAAETSTT